MRLFVSFRDLSARDQVDRILQTVDRTALRMTCMLRFEPEWVNITDLVHTLGPNGWQVQKSSYRKLRLSVQTLVRFAKGAGLRPVFQSEQAGLQAIAFERG